MIAEHNSKHISRYVPQHLERRAGADPYIFLHTEKCVKNSLKKYTCRFQVLTEYKSIFIRNTLITVMNIYRDIFICL